MESSPHIILKGMNLVYHTSLTTYETVFDEKFIRFIIQKKNLGPTIE